MLTSSDRKAKIWSVIRVSGGNFLEMYDFMVFGYYASAIGKAFFPSSSDDTYLVQFRWKENIHCIQDRDY